MMLLFSTLTTGTLPSLITGYCNVYNVYCHVYNGYKYNLWKMALEISDSLKNKSIFKFIIFQAWNDSINLKGAGENIHKEKKRR